MMKTGSGAVDVGHKRFGEGAGPRTLIGGFVLKGTGSAVKASLLGVKSSCTLRWTHKTFRQSQAIFSQAFHNGGGARRIIFFEWMFRVKLGVCLDEVSNEGDNVVMLTEEKNDLVC